MEFNTSTEKLIQLVGNIMESHGFHQSHPVTQRWGKDGVYHLTYDEFYLEMCGNDNPYFPGGVSVRLMKGSLLGDATGQDNFNDEESLMKCIRYNFPK